MANLQIPTPESLPRRLFDDDPVIGFSWTLKILSLFYAWDSN